MVNSPKYTGVIDNINNWAIVNKIIATYAFPVSSQKSLFNSKSSWQTCFCCNHWAENLFCCIKEECIAQKETNLGKEDETVPVVVYNVSKGGRYFYMCPMQQCNELSLPCCCVHCDSPLCLRSSSLSVCCAQRLMASVWLLLLHPGAVRVRVCWHEPSGEDAEQEGTTQEARMWLSARRLKIHCPPFI